MLVENENKVDKLLYSLAPSNAKSKAGQLGWKIQNEQKRYNDNNEHNFYNKRTYIFFTNLNKILIVEETFRKFFHLSEQNFSFL